MNINRRRLLATGLAGGAAAAAFPLSSFGHDDAENSNYAKLDAVLAQPTFKKELFADPVIIESVELLRYGRSFLCRVRSKDGAEGISVAHNTMNVLYPIFVNRVQPVFIDQDARRLDELLEKALVYALNFRLGGLGIGIPLATVEFAILDMMGRIAGKPVGELIGSIHNTHVPVYQATEWREKPVKESVALIKAAVERSKAKAVKIKVGALMFMTKDLDARGPAGRTEEMVECERCQNLMPASDIQQAIADEDDFECSSCGRLFLDSAPVTTVYRMTGETLARPKPIVATADVDSALRELDQSASVFRRLGQVWVLKYEGEMILMQDARGMSYLARLLVEPGRVVPAVALLAAVAGIDPRIATGTSGRLLDDEAMAKYKKQYTELQGDLDEAERRNDLGRIAKLQSEMEAFELEIARATGLGGRKREKTDAERVRKNVSMAVTRAIDSIRDEHAVLGRHLRNSISPGLTFCYDPERDPNWLT